MIEGIIVCVVLVLALVALYLWNKPKAEIQRMEIPPLPEVKPVARQRSANAAFAAEYGKATDWGKVAREEREEQERRAIRRDAEEREARLRRQHIRDEEDRRRREDSYNEDSSVDLLTTVVTAAAAVVVAETLYDSFVDTAPAQTYSSPTPSYSEPTNYSSPDTSTSDTSSSWD